VPAPCITGSVSTAHGTQHTDMSYSYVERGGAETFEPFDYLGFRYLQIDSPGERLVPGDIVALVRHAAVPDEQAGTFSSSNPTIDAVFALAAHSALYTAQEQYIDTPTREKGSWLWDGFNESEAAMAAFGEQNLSRKSLLEFAESQRRYWPNGAVNKIYPTGLRRQIDRSSAGPCHEPAVDEHLLRLPHRDAHQCARRRGLPCRRRRCGDPRASERRDRSPTFTPVNVDRLDQWQAHTP
jgi:hypothetical protein